MKHTIFPHIEKIDFNKKLKVKFGIDPTSDKLHLGHLIPLLAVKDLWSKGHSIDFVLGTFTAQLGDPSGKDTMRPILTENETEKNAQNIIEQINRIFGGNDLERITFHRNGDWFKQMSAIEMTNILAKFTTTQLLSRDSFQNRLKENNPIGMHELVVPLLQGYDSVKLNSDVEIGGNDQLFNFGISRDMQRLHGQTPEVCMLMPIINGTDGRKMSKSFNNCIFINDKPEEVFGKTMSISDALMQEWWPIFFDVEQINMHFPMEQKKKLAFQITTKIWSFKAAEEAQEHFQSIIQKGQIPDEMIEISAITDDKSTSLLDIIVKLRKCSKSEAMRLVKSGAVSIDGAKVDRDMTISKPGFIVKVGKRDFAKII